MSEESQDADISEAPLHSCPECEGPMSAIWIIDRNYRSLESLSYSRPGAKQSFWTGRLPDSGTVEALMCADCGRINLYGRPGS